MGRDLERGPRVYDWWGRHPRLFRALDEIVCLGRRQQLHRRAVDALGLRSGDGVNFALLEEAIGPSGRLVALDYSEQMVTAARERVLREGWHNVEVLQSDAAHMELRTESLDGAVCTLGLSVVSDQRGAIERVKAALGPGGRFVVLD